MAARLRSQLTYANVVSTLCLFILLGGAAYAATRVTGRNVVNGSLTGRDVKDRSLKPADFRAGALPEGPRGPAGAPGARGPAGPAGASGSPDTPAQVRTKLMSVDGAGSGIDADLIDGAGGPGGDLGGTFGDLQLTQGSVGLRELASGGPFGSYNFGSTVPAGGCVAQAVGWDQANLGEVLIALPESADLGAGIYMRPTVVSHPGQVVVEICNASGAPVDIPGTTFFQLRLIA